MDLLLGCSNCIVISGLLLMLPVFQQLSHYIWPRLMMNVSQHILNKPAPDVPWYSSWSPSVTFTPESSVSGARANMWTAAVEGWWPLNLMKSLNSWYSRVEKFRIKNNFLLLTCISIFIHACAAAANMLTGIKQFAGWILRQCFTFGRDIIKQICWKLDDGPAIELDQYEIILCYAHMIGTSYEAVHK